MSAGCCGGTGGGAFSSSPSSASSSASSTKKAKMEFVDGDSSSPPQIDGLIMSSSLNHRNTHSRYADSSIYDNHHHHHHATRHQKRAQQQHLSSNNMPASNNETSVDLSSRSVGVVRRSMSPKQRINEYFQSLTGGGGDRDGHGGSISTNHTPNHHASSSRYNDSSNHYHTRHNTMSSSHPTAHPTTSHHPHRYSGTTSRTSSIKQTLLNTALTLAGANSSSGSSSSSSLFGNIYNNNNNSANNTTSFSSANNNNSSSSSLSSNSQGAGNNHHLVAPPSPATVATAVAIMAVEACAQENNMSLVHPDMCHYCFDVLYAYLHDLEMPQPPTTIKNDSFPLFVTWKLGKSMRLRGCIGTFNSLGLQNGLREYAISSAFHDSRFPPITKDELPRLSVSVSILHAFEPANDHLDWTIGTHGIRIEFNSDRSGSKKTATYLPEVAPEQGWDHLQTIDSLLRKAGFKGTITSEFRRALRVTRYKSQKVTVTYIDYTNSKANCSNNHHSLRQPSLSSSLYGDGYT